MMQQQDFNQQPSTFFDAELADDLTGGTALTMAMAQQIFDCFKTSLLFRWSDANNDCEDRANAACLLLDSWGVANAKSWVFSEAFRGKGQGQLNNLWNYHVAAALPVQEGKGVIYYVIDPATSPGLIPVDEWALQITESGCSYHFVKQSVYYIFPNGTVTKDNWFKRNKRNYNWTMQGLSGINGVSVIGRAQLAFKKDLPKKAEQAFKKMSNERPSFLNG